MKSENFSTKKVTYTRKELKSQTVKNLRQLAKNDQIQLMGAKRKDEIVNVMLAYYLEVKSSESEITLPKTFDVLTDDNNNINVGVWFQGNSRALERCISSTRFLKLLDQYCKKNQKQPHEILIRQDKNNHLYLPPVLAVFVASYLSPRLHYEILEYYLYGKVDEMESVYKAKISSLEQQLVIAELGVKLNRGLSWVSFEAPFAYYWFLIDETVKGGAVGTNNNFNDSNKENLNMRLASHRSTHAKLVLLGVIKFRDSATVTTFENWMKIVLSGHSIGSETLLEQYECSEGNPEIVITKIIVENFEKMGEGSGSLCNQELIDQYNNISKNRLK